MSQDKQKQPNKDVFDSDRQSPSICNIVAYLKYNNIDDAQVHKIIVTNSFLLKAKSSPKLCQSI